MIFLCFAFLNNHIDIIRSAVVQAVKFSLSANKIHFRADAPHQSTISHSPRPAGIAIGLPGLVQMFTLQPFSADI